MSFVMQEITAEVYDAMIRDLERVPGSVQGLENLNVLAWIRNHRYFRAFEPETNRFLLRISSLGMGEAGILFVFFDGKRVLSIRVESKRDPVKKALVTVMDEWSLFAPISELDQVTREGIKESLELHGLLDASDPSMHEVARYKWPVKAVIELGAKF